MKIFKATIESVDRASVVLSLADGQRWRVPADLFQTSPTVGAQIELNLSPVSAGQAGEQALAQDILNEILGGSGQP